MNAIITLKDVSDLIGAKTFVIVGENLKDDTLDVLILPDTGGRDPAEVLVVGAAVDP